MQQANLDKKKTTMLNKLHEFKIDADKRICRICKEQRQVGITDLINPKTKQITGAMLSLQCYECYAAQENILIITYLQPSEQSLVLTES
jgi:hypothetical protein